MKELTQFIESKGFELDFPCDGEFYRFDRGGILNGWFCGKKYVIDGKTVLVVSFGDWRTGEKYTWKNDHEFSKEELTRIHTETAQLDETEKKKKDQRRLEVAELSEAKLRLLKKAKNHGYFAKKGIPDSDYGCYQDGDLLLIPARDIDGKLWGFQKITPTGAKSFTYQQKTKECFHVIGPLTESTKTLGIAEGVATAVSLHLGTELPIVSAFNTANLEAVAAKIRQKFPKIEIVLFYDNDLWTKKPDGTAWNPGYEYACAAAQKVGGRVCGPVFTPPVDGLSDWNDLHVAQGLGEVTRQVKEFLEGGLDPASPDQPRTTLPVYDAQGGGSGELYPELEPLEWAIGKTGKMVAPSDMKVVHHLLSWYGDRLVCQERDLFLYTGTHWKHLDTNAERNVKQQLQFVFGGTAKHAHLVSLFELLLVYCRPAPVDMFLPRAMATNFSNGTLHLVRGADYTLSKEFRPHNFSDYLTNVIPLEYAPEKGAKNEAFLDMIKRVTAHDDDQAEKIRSIRQMYGAMLCPIRPHFFLLHGPAGGGKSSVIIPATRLIHQDNLSSVEPHEFKGFLMESMVGKLVNVVTDIAVNQQIDDANLKKVEDRIPIRIDRKFKTAIRAPLPALHIFGANNLPPSLDGASGAHARRWTFIRLDRHKTEEGKYMHDFGNWVFDQSPQGVLNFALEGLDDLIASGGHFVVPGSGKAAMAEWQMEADPVGLFLRDAERGEVDGSSKVFAYKGGSISRTALWAGFTDWADTSEKKYQRIGRNTFFRLLQEKGYTSRHTETGFVVDGLSVTPMPNSKF